ncbi:Zn(2)-C6 fungal-type DNA-binding domain [Phaffia rhodozyma]|uniref:Zn(2)-C6 fungal-type DNA-binding domain n=1 Tax=Phaffia rhodozyma TaxID=264483 RepID=A0A0F7SYC1_PHARH|nr:Zn(2)-C6 fungal-type DNA-binding domain [Phaffia rhodozyma]
MTSSSLTSPEDRSDIVALTKSDQITKTSVETRAKVEMDERVDLGIKRKRVERACLNCRKRRIKCNGAEPKCEACTNFRSECAYPPPTHKLTIKNFEALQRRIHELESKLAHATEQTSLSQASRLAHEPIYPLVSTQPLPLSAIQHASSTFPQSSDISHQTPFQTLPTSTFQTEPAILPILSTSLSIIPELVSVQLDDPSNTGQPYTFPTEMLPDETQTGSLEITQSQHSSQLFDSMRDMDQYGIPTGSETILRGAQFGEEYNFEELFETETRASQESEPVPMVQDFITHAQLEPVPVQIKVEPISDALDPDLYGLPSSHEVAAMLTVYYEKLYYAFPVFNLDPIYQRYTNPSVQPLQQNYDTSNILQLAMLNRILSIVIAYRGQDGDNMEDMIRSLWISLSAQAPQDLKDPFSCYCIDYYSEVCPSVSKIDVAKEHAILSSFLVHSLQLDLPSADGMLRTDREIQYSLMRAAHLCITVQLSSMLDEPNLTNGCGPMLESELIMLLLYPASVWSAVEPTRSLFSQKQHIFFVETTKLCNLKWEIISKSYTSYNVHQASEMALASTPLDRLLAFQSGLLQCRYIETSIMLYRPCLVGHFLGQEVSPGSIGQTLTNLTLCCAEAALASINTVLKTWNTILQGFWWYLVGFAHNSCLILLAFQTTPIHPLNFQYERKQARSFETVQHAIGFILQVVQYNPSAFPESVECPIPSEDVRLMGRRCIGVLDKLTKVINPRTEGQMRAQILPLDLRNEEASFKDSCFVADWIQKISPDRRNHEFTS